MSAFEEDEEEPTNEISFIEDSDQETPVQEEPKVNSGSMTMDFTEDEIEAMLEQEAQKAHTNFTEPSKQSESMDLFPSEDFEDEQDTGWFPIPKGE